MSLYQGHRALVTHIWADVVIHPPLARIMGSIVAIPGVLRSLCGPSFTPLARHAYQPIFFLFPVIMRTAGEVGNSMMESSRSDNV